MLRQKRSELLARARQWVRANQCPLPLDLAFEMLEVGLDATAIESDLLNDDADPQLESENE